MENIQVALRLRPLSSQEKLQGEDSIWDIQAPHSINLQNHLHKELVYGKRLVTGSRTSFTFDNCFGPVDQNELIYNESVRNIVLGSLKGINGSVFVYGQTGSGKTYTMLGPQNSIQETQAPDQGILLQALRELFDNIQRDLDKTYVLRCSYIEIYNEQIFDLLKPASRLSELLTISEDSKKEFFVKGVTEESAQTVHEIMDVLQRGEINRHYAQTSMNHNSSRSHAIFRLTVQSITNNFIQNYRRESQFMVPDLEIFEQSQDLEDEKVVKGALITESILNFIDLAGSEKVSNHTNSADETFASQVAENRFEENFVVSSKTRERVKEGQYINKSLFFLTQVILLRAEDKGHIPYRNSSLTKILRSSLSGNSRTLIILCVNPTYFQFEYSLSTIRFGMNAKRIENKVGPNIRNNNNDEAVKIIIAEYEKRIRDLEKAKIDDKETMDSMRIVLNQQNQLIDDLQERLKNINKNNFNQNQSQIQVKTRRNRLATCVQTAKLKDGIHIDNIGDIFQANRTKSKVKVEMRIKQFNHDCQGIIALSAFRAQKQRSTMLQEQIVVLLQNYYKVKDDSLEMYQLQKQLEQMKKNNETSALEFRKLYIKAEQMAKILDLSELPKIIETKLIDMKEFYNSYVKEIEQEQWRRKILFQLQIKQTSLNNDNYDNQLTRKDAVVSQNQALTENKVYTALYQSMEKYEQYTQQIIDIGRNLVQKTQQMNDQSDIQKASERSKANEIDCLFFDGFNDQWNQDTMISFEDLQELMKQQEIQGTNSTLTTPESLRINSAKQSTNQSIKKVDSGLQNQFTCDNTQQLDEKKLPKSFSLALMDFIDGNERVDKQIKDTMNKTIITIDEGESPKSNFASYLDEFGLIQKEIHYSKEIKRSYQTPENKLKSNNRTQPIKPDIKYSHTPNKNKYKQSMSLHAKTNDRQQNKVQAQHATKLRRLAASGDSAKDSFQTVSQSKLSVSKQTKSSNKFKLSASIMGVDENVFSSVAHIKQNFLPQTQMNDITNSANKKMKVRPNNAKSFENFQKLNSHL